jgi:hypothetical protein
VLPTASLSSGPKLYGANGAVRGRASIGEGVADRRGNRRCAQSRSTTEMGYREAVVIRDLNQSRDEGKGVLIRRSYTGEVLLEGSIF